MKLEKWGVTCILPFDDNYHLQGFFVVNFRVLYMYLLRGETKAMKTVIIRATVHCNRSYEDSYSLGHSSL